MRKIKTPAALTALLVAVLAPATLALAAAPFLPPSDPAVPGEPIQFLPAAAQHHPRLLFTAGQIPAMKAFYNSPQGKLYHDQMEGYLSLCTVPADRKMSPGWGQEYGLMRIPMVALHYVLTGDKDSFNKSVAYLKWLAGTADWTDGGEPPVADTPAAYAKVLDTLEHFGPKEERNSDTTASFTMVGAALTFDWLYNDLDPAFREEFRQVLWQHARVMYYGGHKGGNPGGGYWRSVPAYNHRWFRDWGLSLATFASAEGKPDQQWLLGQVKNELAFMDNWLPVDGSQHEGPGYGSSAGALGMAFDACDSCIGTRFLDAPFYRTAAGYTLDVSAPGMHESLYFADCFDKAGSFQPYFLKTAANLKQADVVDGIRHALAVNSTKFGMRDYAWLSLLSDNPAITGGDYHKLPTSDFLPDLGISITRDSWNDNAVAALFKCGPMGGYKANAWRASAAVNGKLPYLNVAHDHPDANSFEIFGDGQYLAETDRYPLHPGKLSSSLNTILINGLGQNVQGRQQGDDWQQPGDGDMTKMGVITALKNAGDEVLVEGEASGSYPAYSDKKTRTSHPALDRFRRTFIWIKGGYILVLDDVRAPQPVDITFLTQGAKLSPADEAKGVYTLAKGDASCHFTLTADAPLKSVIGESTANVHGKLMGWQQLQATAHAKAVRFASVFDPWNHKDLQLTLKTDGPDRATVTVSSASAIFTDTWQWQAAPGRFTASTISGSRKGGFTVTLDPASTPPSPLPKESNPE